MGCLISTTTRATYADTSRAKALVHEPYMVGRKLISTTLRQHASRRHLIGTHAFDNKLPCRCVILMNGLRRDKATALYCCNRLDAGSEDKCLERVQFKSKEVIATMDITERICDEKVYLVGSAMCTSRVRALKLIMLIRARPAPPVGLAISPRTLRLDTDLEQPTSQQTVSLGMRNL